MPAENTIEVFIRVIGDPDPPELIGHLWEADCDICGFSPLLGPDGGPINGVAHHLHKQITYLEEEKAPYDPNYGDEKLCACGHTYYRHFDSYEEMEPVGCKYCLCESFTPER